MKKALLAIHYYLPPTASIAVVRNLEMLKQWSQFTDEQLVLTSSNRHRLFADHTNKIPQSITMIDLPTNDYRTRWAKKKQKGHLSESQKSGLLQQSKIKIINSFPFIYWLGEGGRRYIKSGIKEGRAYLQKNPEAYIYSSFRPYADHIIAYSLAMEFPKAKWVADFRDLHMDPLYKHYIFKGYQEKKNQKILQRANALCTVSKGLARQLSHFNENVVVVNSGVVRRKKEALFATFTISYTGSLFLEERDPQPLFKVLHELISEGLIDAKEITFIYAGKDQSTLELLIKKYELHAILENKGLVGRDEALTIQSKSHINLLLSSSRPIYQGVLTGKFFEYLGAGRPILLSLKGNQDPEFSDYFSKYDLGYIHHDEISADGMKTYLLESYLGWKKEKKVKAIASEKIENELSWASNFSKLIHAIEP